MLEAPALQGRGLRVADRVYAVPLRFGCRTLAKSAITP
jgi:hypothetical protein